MVYVGEVMRRAVRVEEPHLWGRWQLNVCKESDENENFIVSTLRKTYRTNLPVKKTETKYLAYYLQPVNWKANGASGEKYVTSFSYYSLKIKTTLLIWKIQRNFTYPNFLYTNQKWKMGKLKKSELYCFVLFHFL